MASSYLGASLCALLLFLVHSALSSLQIASQWTKFQISLLLGVGVAIFSIVSCTLFLIPMLIITWTTALVIQFLFGKSLRQTHRFIQDGNRMAMEIFHHSLVNILQEGKVAGVVAGTVCFFSLNKQPWQFSQVASTQSIVGSEVELVKLLALFCKACGHFWSALLFSESLLGTSCPNLWLCA